MIFFHIPSEIVPRKPQAILFVRHHLPNHIPIQPNQSIMCCAVILRDLAQHMPALCKMGRDGIRKWVVSAVPYFALCLATNRPHSSSNVLFECWRCSRIHGPYSGIEEMAQIILLCGWAFCVQFEVGEEERDSHDFSTPFWWNVSIIMITDIAIWLSWQRYSWKV